jgi:hypothetical protein
MTTSANAQRPQLAESIKAGLTPPALRKVAAAARAVARTRGFTADPGQSVDGYVAEHMAFLSPEQRGLATVAILDFSAQQANLLDLDDSAVTVVQQALQTRAAATPAVGDPTQAAATASAAIAANMK